MVKNLCEEIQWERGEVEYIRYTKQVGYKCEIRRWGLKYGGQKESTNDREYRMRKWRSREGI